MRLSPFTQFEFKELRNITIGHVFDCIFETMNMIRPNKLVFFMEKIALLVCITMLLCQNYYSLMTYWQQDYIETKADAQLFNIDLPMIMICGENPFINDLDPLGFDSKWEFIGWANENASAKDDIKSNTRLQNVSDIVNAAHTLDDLMFNNNSAKELKLKKLRITPFDGQCFSVVVPKNFVESQISKSFSFSLAVFFPNNSDARVFLLDPNIYNGFTNPEEALLIRRTQFFDVTLAQREQNPEDPNAMCEMYDSPHRYYDCVTSAAENWYLSTIGCVPPWFSDNEDLICQNDKIELVKERFKAILSLIPLYVEKTSGEFSTPS